MSLLENTPRLFPTALTNFLDCHHLAVLERLAAANLAKISCVRPATLDAGCISLRLKGCRLFPCLNQGKRQIET